VHTLKVATLNVWNKSGPWAHRRELIRREIAQLLPDIMGMQELLRLLPFNPGDPDPPRAPPGGGQAVPLEVCSPGGFEGGSWSTENDQLTELCSGIRLAEGTSYFGCFFQARGYGGGLVMGNGLVSRFPIREARGYALPGEESGETRSLVYALVQTPWGLLPVFVTHLNWKLHHGSVRLRQLRFIVDRIDELAPLEGAPDDQLPALLLGDFNAEPDSDEIRFLRGHHTIDGMSVHFADSWIWGGDGTPGYTFDRKNGFALRSNEPPRRIDYIFARGPDDAFRGEPLSARLAFTEGTTDADSTSVGQVWPSDHFGLVAELAVEKRRTD
jgi:endonuclease/exonuclease/phosphatase family metal-dependent hydrolase